jgi:hypothetical protein
LCFYSPACPVPFGLRRLQRSLILRRLSIHHQYIRENRRTNDWQSKFSTSASQVGILAAWLLLVGCATLYQPMGALGGYQEERLAPEIYRVAFFGNASS